MVGAARPWSAAVEQVDCRPRGGVALTSPHPATTTVSGRPESPTALDRMQKLSEFVSSRELFDNLTLRELRGKYKRSALGWTWSLLNPLTSMVDLHVVFGVFLGVEPARATRRGLDDLRAVPAVRPAAVDFLTNGLNGGMGSLVGNDGLVKKVYFPREILVAASTASLGGVVPHRAVGAGGGLLFVGNIVLLWLPVVLVLVVLQTVFVLGLALMLSRAERLLPRHRSTCSASLLQVWFYATPIVYPMTLVQSKLGRRPAGRSTLYNLNPMARFVEAYRDVLYDLRCPALDHVAYLVVVSVVSLWLGLVVFRRLQGRLAEEL